MLNKALKTIIFLIWILIFPASIHSFTYYISPSGNDSYNGLFPNYTSGTTNGLQNGPWATPKKAGDTAIAGDTVYFREGVYFDSLIPKNSGSSAAWIVFSAYPGEKPEIKSSQDGVTIKTWPVSGKTYEQMISYIEISGLNIQGAVKGIRLDQAHHIRLKHNIIHDSAVGGIAGPNGKDHILIESNVIYGNSNGGGPCSSGISLWNSGCFFGESSTCMILDNQATGYHIFIKDNIIYGNRNDDSNCGFPNPSDGNGIILDNNGDDMPLTLIANNLIYHNGGRCIQSLNSDNAHIIHNTCWENLQTDRMQNNGAGEILLDQHEIQGSSMTFDNVVVKNNIIYGHGDGCPWQAWGVSNSGYKSDFNLWYQEDIDGNYYSDWSNILNNYRSCGWNHGSNEIIGSDPLFVSTPTCKGSGPYYECDWDSNDFRLQLGSSAIDRGTDEFALIVNSDFAGNLRSFDGNEDGTDSFDIGAYEYVVSSIPGDANGDNHVTGADYVIWLNNYGQTSGSGYSVGDFNLDTYISGTDYVIWLNNYGR